MKINKPIEMNIVGWLNEICFKWIACHSIISDRAAKQQNENENSHPSINTHIERVSTPHALPFRTMSDNKFIFHFKYENQMKLLEA